MSDATMSEDTPPISDSAGRDAETTSFAGKRSTLIGALVVGVLAILVARHYHRPLPPSDPPAPGMTVGSDSVTLASDAPMWSVVQVAPATPDKPHWTDPVPAQIVFDEAHTSRLGSPLAGRVTAVMVERGQSVKNGAPLFEVSSPNLAELRADLDKALVERNTAQINFDRVKNLVDAGSLPAKELTSAQQETSEAELAVRLAQQKLASLKVAGAGEASFTVSAPRDGVVVEKSVAVGQEVDASGGSLIAIADLSDVWVVADLFENDVGTLAHGDAAKVIVGASTMDGTVDQVSAVVDPQRHTVPVRVKLANPQGLMRPNAYAQVRFYDGGAAAAAIPASAVLFDGAHSYLYVQDAKGALARRVVEVGTPSGGVVPVQSGLKVGEKVVVHGAILLDNQIQLDGDQ